MSLLLLPLAIIAVSYCRQPYSRARPAALFKPDLGRRLEATHPDSSWRRKLSVDYSADVHESLASHMPACGKL